MSENKNDNFGCGMACVLVPMIGFMGIALSFLAGREEPRDLEYVVTDKGAGKIAYYSIDNPANSHVMEFKDTVSFYPYVNVGDTITGWQRFIDKKMAPAEHTTNYGTHQVIYTVNGRDLSEVREIARRDSILRTMRQKQK